MMQALLEESFKLKIHRETREMPVYIMTVAKRGLKLQALPQGSCTARNYNQPPQTNACGNWKVNKDSDSVTVDSRGESLADFAADLSNMSLDRIVVDKTGLTALFNIHLEYSDQSIFTALTEQLGLKLSAGKGPRRSPGHRSR
jgi:uncharacterized protein (TIGR03435 family)